MKRIRKIIIADLFKSVYNGEMMVRRQVNNSETMASQLSCNCVVYCAIFASMLNVACGTALSLSLEISFPV